MELTCENLKVNVPEGVKGKWAVEKFEVKENSSGRFHYAFEGRPVDPGIYTRLKRIGGIDPMMSDTPAEVRDCIDFMWRAKGNVLVNGLGLGMVIGGLSRKDEVTHIDVVEIEQDIIDLVWPTYKDDPKITLYHADAFTIEWEKGKKWDCAWHDIWQDICTDNLPEIAKLKRKYARKVGFQQAWVEDLLRRIRRRENRSGSWW